MALIQAVPAAPASAAEDVGNIGAMLEANAYAALPPSGIVPAEADEVSAAITPLFNNQSAVYRELAAQAAAFQRQFTRLLRAAGVAYTETEEAAQQALRDAITAWESPLDPLLAQAEGPAPRSIPPLIVPQNWLVALVVGGTTFPLPQSPVTGVSLPAGSRAG